MNDDSVFLLAGAGRSGSSLLSAILSSSGADFNVDVNEQWNRETGAFEHPKLDRARAWLSRADKIKTSLWPDMFGHSYCQDRARDLLEQVLANARFAKHPHMVWMVKPIVDLGYQPTIILNYRDFDTFAKSGFLRVGFDFSHWVDMYYDVNKTALLQLEIFGGCVLKYEHILDKSQDAWARTLSEVTGLEKEELIENRDQWVKDRRHGDVSIQAPQRIRDLENELRDSMNEVKSSQVLDE